MQTLYIGTEADPEKRRKILVSDDVAEKLTTKREVLEWQQDPDGHYRMATKVSVREWVPDQLSHNWLLVADADCGSPGCRCALEILEEIAFNGTYWERVDSAPEGEK